MKLIIKLIMMMPIISFAMSVEEYIDLSKCDQHINKKYYDICYSYKYNSALSGYVVLDANSAKEGIKKRPRFYDEKSIPYSHRTTYSDYTGFGRDWNRGHFILADADSDHKKEFLNSSYTMANIVPQSATMNQKTWTKVERYGRMLASKLGSITSLSIARYDNSNLKLKGKITIPTKMYRVYFNKKEGFERCFEYDNVLNVDYKKDKLKDHIVDCQVLKNRRWE